MPETQARGWKIWLDQKNEAHVSFNGVEIGQFICAPNVAPSMNGKYRLQLNFVADHPVILA
jgi:hypothetical protein